MSVDNLGNVVWNGGLMQGTMADVLIWDVNGPSNTCRSMGSFFVLKLVTVRREKETVSWKPLVAFRDRDTRNYGHTR